MTNPKNIDEIIDRYNSRIQTVIKRFFSSDEDVQDLKQEVFIKTWKNLNKYQGKSEFWCWLNKITVNVCRDHLRSKKAKTSLNLSGEDELMQNIPDKKTGPEKTVISTERHKLILNSINKLNPKLREVLILHDIEELTYEEISKKVDCPIGTVKSRLFNARKILKEQLANLMN